jgi:hypothetical protein
LLTYSHTIKPEFIYSFNFNAKDTGWIKAALIACASGIEDREKEAAQYLLKYLCMKYNDAFVHVASKAAVCC